MLGMKKQEPTLRIKLNTSLCQQRHAIDPRTKQPTTVGTKAFQFGSVVDWPKDEAERLIEAGFAIPVVEGTPLSIGLVA